MSTSLNTKATKGHKGNPLCLFAVSHRRAAGVRGTNGVYFVFGFLTYSINFCSFIRSSIAPLTWILRCM